MKKNYLKPFFVSLLLLSVTLLSAQLTPACSPSYPSGGGSWRILSLTVGSFNHSPSSAVQDYTSESFIMNAGTATTIEAVSDGWCGVATAVDFNNDGDFADADELFTYPTYIAADPATYTYTMTIPATTPAGNYRFRIFNIGGNSGGGSPAGSACGNYSYGNWADYTVTVTSTIGCSVPTDFAASFVTDSSATISWTASLTPPTYGYEYYLSTSSTAPTASTVATGSVGPGVLSENLTNLPGNTPYFVWVRSVCSASDTSTWVATSFATTCVTVMAPFFENFDSGILPSCWESTNYTAAVNANTLWKFLGAGGYGTTGNGRSAGEYAWVDASTPNTGYHNVSLISPPIDLTPLSQCNIKFDWYKNNSTTTNSLSNNKLSLEVNDGSGWVSIFSDTSNVWSWRTESIILPASYANATIQLRFTVDKDAYGAANFYDDILLDSIKVIEGPCTSPVVDLGTDTTICIGETLTLDAGVSNSSFTKLWSNGDTTQTIDVTVSGTYYLTVTNGNCFTNDTIVVGVNTLSVDLGADTAICAGDSLTLSAGAANSTFTKLWSNSATTQTISVNTTGTYSVAVTDGACSVNDTIVVDVTPYPVVDLGTDTVICTGQSLSLDAGNVGATYLWNNSTTSQNLTVTTAGTYAVVVSNGDCATTDSIQVGLAPLPTVDSIVFSLTDCSFSFSAVNAQNVVSYDWSFGDGSANSTLMSPTHDYLVTDSFEVTLTVSNACGDTFVLSEYVNCLTVGIKNADLDENALTLYPNPTADFITFENKSNLKMEYLTVFNVLGKVVFQTAPQSALQHQMNVSNLVAGLYIVQVKTNEGIVVKKFEVLK